MIFCVILALKVQHDRCKNQDGPKRKLMEIDSCMESSHVSKMPLGLYESHQLPCRLYFYRKNDASEILLTLQAPMTSVTSGLFWSFVKKVKKKKPGDMNYIAGRPSHARNCIF